MVMAGSMSGRCHVAAVSGNDLQLLQIQYCTVQDLCLPIIITVCSFIEVFTNMNKTLSGPVGYKSQKWSLSLTRVVTYESFSLQRLSDSLKWGLTKVVVKSGQEESFDCSLHSISSSNQRLWNVFKIDRRLKCSCCNAVLFLSFI